MDGQSFGVFSAVTFYNLIAVHITSIQIENNNINTHTGYITGTYNVDIHVHVLNVICKQS